MLGYRIRVAVDKLGSKLFLHKMKILVAVVSLVVVAIVVNFAAPPVISAVQHRIAVHRFNNLSNDDFLYDFNYLVRAMEENWPFFNLSISANDVDVHELADSFRDILNDPSTDIDALEFLDTLRYHFMRHVGNLGHLRAEWRYETYFNLVQGTRDWILAFLSGFSHVPERLISDYRLYTRIQTVVFYEALRDAGGSRLITEGFDTGDTPSYETAIIEEGNIAHLTINRMIEFWQDPGIRDGTSQFYMGHYERILFDFYNDIEDFNHLIIDLRGNSGGPSTHFDVFVAGQILHDVITLPAYVFYTTGAYSAQARETFFPFIVIYAYFVPPLAPAVIEEPLPYFNQENNFSHVFYSSYILFPWEAYDGWRASFTMRDRPGFDGKLWILTDGGTGSSAEAVAAIFKYNNLATVVGEPTFGIMGTIFEPFSIDISLPNTGILIRMDIAYYTTFDGRSLQGYGIMPNYFNRPGMDALETVLAMIEEGNY